MVEQNKILLPRTHLSWSQLSIWQSNPDRYRREYFENSAKLDTKFLQFGKGIAKLIESGKHKELLPGLIVYEKPEFEIRTTLAGVPLLSYLDSYDPALNVFMEYKTAKRNKDGKDTWTQAKVQKHDQLPFYAVALRALTGKMPEYCDLVMIETKEERPESEIEDFWRSNEKEISLTGRMKTFHRDFDERELERMERLIIKCANEISEAYQSWLNEI